MPINKRIRLRPITSVIGVLFLLLSITGLSADVPRTAESSSPPSSLLYSNYSPTAVDGGDVLGSFVVRVPKWDGWASGRQVLRRTRDELGALPLRQWVSNHVMEGESISEQGRSRAEGFAWGLARSAAEEGILSATDELRRRHFIETVNVELDAGLGDRFANIGVDLLGSLHETDDQVIAWQLRGSAGKDSRNGGNAGLIYRRAVSDNWLVGANTFLDYQTEDEDNFLRWSLGVETRSDWVDIFANYYEGISDDVIQRRANSAREEAIWTASGYDIELNVHAPSQQWLTGVLGYYAWEGKYGRADVEGLRIGLKVSTPGVPLRWELTYENEDEGDNIGGRISYHHRLGGSSGGASFSSKFRPRDWFYAPVEREYTQRVYRQEVDSGVIQSITVFVIQRVGGATVTPLPADIRITLTRAAPVAATLVYNPSVASETVDVLSFLNADGAVELKKTNPPNQIIVVQLTYESGRTRALMDIRSTVILEGLSVRLVEGAVSLRVTTGTFTVSGPENVAGDVVVRAINPVAADLPAELVLTYASGAVAVIVDEQSNGDFDIVEDVADETDEEGINLVCQEGETLVPATVIEGFSLSGARAFKIWLTRRCG